MPPRAPSMSPDERRQALIEATLPLLGLHGRAVTTRQIAEAAGVAEGTIFRVFESKDALVDAALEAAFEPGGFVDEIRAIDPDLELPDRLIELATILQRRFQAIFGLMRAVGMVAPPEHTPDRVHDRARHVQQALAAMIEVIQPDRHRLRVPVAQAVHVLRMLAFSGSHEEISQGQLLSPVEIVDILLHGLLRQDPTHEGGR